ncbi:hypothetical protein IWW36_001643 [Coemansia brasiliensis]|uniref:Uncharacterized protein n=1 Tax=Coemansia brasiliensis TaxID=2650707 RepID=A0A9W8IB90_9FUNG|nr:hypothetical protein IWW36_001643 [Coemansia brasiliensis]
MQTTTVTAVALAVAGTAFAASPAPNNAKAVNKNSSPDPRTVTVTTTVNGAGANSVSFAAAALAGAMAFASFVSFTDNPRMIAKITTALAFTAALASAQAPAEARNDYAAGGGHNKPYLTVTAPNVVQPAPVVAAAPTVVQNAASAEPTVTETVTNGASSVMGSLGMSVAALAGSVLAASYF